MTLLTRLARTVFCKRGGPRVLDVFRHGGRCWLTYGVAENWHEYEFACADWGRVEKGQRRLPKGATKVEK